MRTRYVIVGNGAAGITAAETIRQADPSGQIQIVTAEPYPMYSRPGLAYVLTGEISPDQVIARQPAWYRQLDLELVQARASRLHVATQHLYLEDGRVLAYDRLLLATGARAVPPPYPGHDLGGVVYLDTLAGTRSLLRQARRGRRAVVIGGGITALEMAEGLAQQGVRTHYFVRRDRLWSKVFNDVEAGLLEERMRHHGVTVHYHTEIAEILGNWRRRVRAVRLESGAQFPCRLVGVAIGVRPQLDLVAGTPLKVDRAILVDEYLHSSVPNVFAAGDCAQVYDRWTGRHMLDILWPSAVAEGRAAGHNMAGGRVAYRKGIPFNVCLLFGLHITAIGQINPRPEEDDVTSAQPYLSRGSSEVWFTFPRHYSSAWSADGPNTLRLTASEDRLVGALLIGEQSLADPLRDLIEHEVNIASLQPFIDAGGPALRQAIGRLWARWRQREAGPCDE